MGLQIGNIVPRRAIDFKELKNKIIAVDAFNTIYQFLSTIRQPDGTPLKDNKGNVTSHLSGLFYRNLNLMLEGLKLVYVFDGKTPDLKKATHEKRQEVKDKARESYERAKKKEDIEGMGKYSKQLSELNDEMIEESKELLKAMGIQVIQAPGEGEAEASYLARIKEEIYGVGSQDYDSLLFGAPFLIQNLTFSRKRKTVSGYKEITPELIELERVFNTLQINQEQLICLGILCGTDYNPKGVLGIGPKKALSIVQEKKIPSLIFKSVEEKLDFDWQEIFSLFKKPAVKDAEIKFPKVDKDKIKEILMKRDFSEQRIDKQFEKLDEIKKQASQKTLF